MPTLFRLSLGLSHLLLASIAMAQSNIEVAASGGMLSVQAEHVSASQLAAEISEKLGISVVVTGDAETPVNLDIVDEPIEKALGKLSPNIMLVRSSDASEIIEVVLMMGEGQSGSGGNSEEFLPSGSPADAVIDEQTAAMIEETYDPEALRNPDRSAQVREAASAASSDANLPAEQLPPMYALDIQNSDAIDPATGLPFQ